MFFPTGVTDIRKIGIGPVNTARRRPRQLAKNTPRFLYARSFAGSSPCDGPITKKPPLLGALSFNGAGERTSAYPLRGSAPASAACRRPRQLAKNAPRFLCARSFAGSSPCDGPITKSPHCWELFHLMVRAKGLEPSWGCPHTDLNRTRLPIPPRPRAGIRITERHRERKNYF